MERFYYERPSIARKDRIIDFLDEFVSHGSEINGSGSLDRIYEGYTFEAALENCLNMEDPEYARGVNWCPGKTFLLIRENDDRIVGTVNIRWDMPADKQRFRGNIGYGIRPEERRKGYAKLNLYMALKEAYRLGLERVMIGCSAENSASERTIQALGGILDRKEIDPEDNTLSCYYWIDVLDSINKNREHYEGYICER